MMNSTDRKHTLNGNRRSRSAYVLVLTACLIAASISAVAQDPGNVLIVRQPAPANGEPRVYQSFHVPDWTKGTGGFQPTGELDVMRDLFIGGHLSDASPTTLLNVFYNPADFTILTNRVAPDRSSYYVDPPQDPVDLYVRAFPPGGVYNHTIQLEFNVGEPGSGISYRLNQSGPFIGPATAPTIFIFEDTTVEYFSEMGLMTSPTYIETYEINQRGDVDTDGDLIPDFVEVELQMDPMVANGDDDGDGWNAFEELQRGTDPFDLISFPADSDIPPATPGLADRWSDYDEILRQTDPDDYLSKPVASAVDVAEYILNGTPGVEVPEGSRLDFLRLLGVPIRPASAAEGGFQTRLAGDQSYVARLINAEKVDIVYLGYVPKYAPCLDLASIFTPGMSADEWFAGYRTLYEPVIFTERSGMVLDASTTAFVLALGRFIEIMTGSEEPIVLGDLFLSPSAAEIAVVTDTHDLDEVSTYLEGETGNMTGLVSLVGNYAGWIEGGADPSAPLHRLIGRGLFGDTPAPEDLPPGVDAGTFSAAAAEVDLVLAAAPSLVLSITGTIQIDANGITTIDYQGTTYEVNLSRFNYRVGSTVHLLGLRREQCENPSVVLVEPTALEVIDSGVVPEEDDSEPDGLADTWEKFWFGTLALGPNDDPDNDGDTNIVEFNNYTNPIDEGGTPVTPSPTPVVTFTPTPSPSTTPLGTPPPTPTFGPTPTPFIFDVLSDGIVDESDLLLVVSDMINSPTSERSNFDGIGEVDYRDLFLFASWWHFQTTGQ